VTAPAGASGPAGVGARAAGAAAALALAAGLALASRAPYAVEAPDAARLRLSWRALGEPVHACRVPTDAELAALPPHMRQKEICERRLAPFQLRVALDGVPLVDGEIRASGAREDRPTYVFRDFEVSPGEHRVEVRFEEVRPPGAAPAPPALSLDRTVHFAPRRIRLVTRAAEGAALSLD
jgi:hypothetical protein